MICGLFLMVGCAIMGIVCLFAGSEKWVLLMFLGIVLGAFLYFDVPRIIHVWERNPIQEQVK